MLQITGLVKNYQLKGTRPFAKRTHEVLRGVDFEIQPGETHALVGESGSGKSTLAQCVLGFTPVTAGEIRFKGIPLESASTRQYRAIRQDLQSVFQDPYASLNARMRVRDIIGEPLLIHERNLSPQARRERVSRVMEQVHLPEELLARYPHSLSGGQRQRVSIARALIVRPQLIVCDEILSALDVSVQARVISLLKEIQREEGVSYLFITHDFGVVRQLSHRVSVLRSGRIVETGPAEQVLDRPADDYTQMLLSAVPGQGMSALQETRARLREYRAAERVASGAQR
jgi:oligopeptide transport system ATP-binding protein